MAVKRFRLNCSLRHDDLVLLMMIFILQTSFNNKMDSSIQFDE